jgi:type II secretory pathway pseudopilin PulG
MINVNTKSGIIVSASMAIVATQAMAYFASAGKDSKAIEAANSENEQLRAAVKAAVAKRDVRMAINSAFDALSSSFGDANGDSLAKKYFPDGNVRLAQTSDFTSGRADAYCYSNCHSACHDACHGSRGWR